MNKKSILTWALTLTFTLSAVPFGFVRAEERDNGIPAKVISAPVRGITVNKLNPYVLNEKEQNTIFGNFQNEIESLKTQTGYYVFDNEKYGIKDSNVYVLISLGQKPTGGYGIKVVSVEDNEGVSAITIEETKPAPDMMLAQVITYPYIIVRFSQGTPNVKVETTSGIQFNSLGNTEELTEKRWKELKPWTNVAADKQWLITFNKDISKAVINNNTIYIRNSSGRIVPADVVIESDKKTARVIPQEYYEEGETYYLFISDRMNGSISYWGNKPKGYRMMFTVEKGVVIQSVNR